MELQEPEDELNDVGHHIHKKGRSMTLTCNSITPEEARARSNKDTHSELVAAHGSNFVAIATAEELEESFSMAQFHVHGDAVGDQKRTQERPLKIYGIDADKVEEKFMSSCMKGFKGCAEGPNQDNFSVTRFANGWTLYCVMDGHGQDGHFIATRAVQVLPYYVARSKFFPSKIEDTLVEAFEMTNMDIVGLSLQDNFDVQISGSTCVSCLINPDGTQMWSAHIGDSRLIYVTEELEFETKDHKPEDATEVKRIRELGGEMRSMKFDDNLVISRIFVKDEEFPGLCMTRSFGDQCVKACGVTYTPAIEGPMAIASGYILLSSDGVWEFMTSKWVATVMSNRIKSEGPSKVLRKLHKHAIRKWREDGENYCDDITSILIVM